MSCAMESECDGEEWFNKMPDGTISAGKQTEKKDELNKSRAY